MNAPRAASRGHSPNFNRVSREPSRRQPSSTSYSSFVPECAARVLRVIEKTPVAFVRPFVVPNFKQNSYDMSLDSL
ncbi:hypothetical protein GE061_004552 [Apolygus lucorum]|uniref:Uncharacterized protein n=1 Tax=Apolygus lucorum TaxID=248454 RepID=A0A6A4IJR2_APOLU|nr:hypothetical protein GE061_004552 [Apolygus lucorum]